MTVPGYVPSATEQDPVKLARGIRNLYENGASASDVADIQADVAIIEGDITSLDGRVTALEGGGGRELLTADRTYYVRTDGDDGNDGLSDDSTGAFLTIQRAVDVIAATLDIAAYTVTIQVADGTYADVVDLKNVVGFGAAGNLVIRGNAATPANVLLSGTANMVNASDLSSVWDILDLKIETTAGHALRTFNSKIRFSNLDFGSCGTGHMSSQDGGQIYGIGDYAVSGGATYHWSGGTRGALRTEGKTITFSNAPAFSNVFINISSGQGLARVDNMTFTNGGTVTGKRYNITSNGVLFVNGAGASYLPGTVAGTTASGGQVV